MRSAIVCVDDEWSILRGLGSQLKYYFGKDYEIELVSSGEDALMLCAELAAEGMEIPLIISDQKMRGMTGDALLIQLHSLYPRTLKIMLTGQADVQSVGNVVNAAALYRYISKPWDETDLILTVSEALRCFQQEQQLAEQNELLKKTNAKLKSSLSLLLATLEATADGILVLDNFGKVVTFNQKFVSIWNLHSDLVLHEDDISSMLMERVAEPDAVDFQELFVQVNVDRHDFLKLNDGSVIEYHLQPQKLTGDIVGRVWSFRDVTQREQTETMIKHQALHDALTNLPNRILLNQKLAAALSDAENGSKLLAIMFLDLDRFKQVNDTLGHVMGDRLLQHFVQRLDPCLRQTDVLARWGGDEFILLLTQIHCREDTDEIAQRLIKALQSEFLIEDYRLAVTISIGIAIYPYHGLDGSTLLQNADSALYKAKKSGRNNYQHYSATL